jgi:hypothetical protein
MDVVEDLTKRGRGSESVSVGRSYVSDVDQKDVAALGATEYDIARAHGELEKGVAYKNVPPPSLRNTFKHAVETTPFGKKLAAAQARTAGFMSRAGFLKPREFRNQARRLLKELNSLRADVGSAYLDNLFPVQELDLTHALTRGKDTLYARRPQTGQHFRATISPRTGQRSRTTISNGLDPLGTPSGGRRRPAASGMGRQPAARGATAGRRELYDAIVPAKPENVEKVRKIYRASGNGKTDDELAKTER